MTTPAEVRETFLAAVAAGDVDTIVSIYHPDAVLEAPEGRFEGREAIAEYFRSQLAPMDAELVVHAVHDTADTGVTEWVMKATLTGPLELPDGTTIPATGQQLRQRGMDVASYVDGRCLAHRIYYDNLEVLAQLGALDGGGK